MRSLQVMSLAEWSYFKRCHIMPEKSISIERKVRPFLKPRASEAIAGLSWKFTQVDAVTNQKAGTPVSCKASSCHNRRVNKTLYL